MLMTAVDPGNTTGWAMFDGSQVVNVGQLKWEEEFFTWLQEQHPDVWVVENYRIRPASMNKGKSNFAHQWSSVIPAQVIGAIQYRAYQTSVEVILQEPAVKPLGAKMGGMTYTTNVKGQHGQDALYHGMYYLKKLERERFSTKPS